MPSGGFTLGKEQPLHIDRRLGWSLPVRGDKNVIVFLFICYLFNDDGSVSGFWSVVSNSAIGYAYLIRMLKEAAVA